MSYQLQFLHASDLEGGLEALNNATNFARLVDHYKAADANTVLVSAGDNSIPGPFYNAGRDGAMRDIYVDVYNEFYGLDTANGYADLRPGGMIADIVLMNLMGFDASAIGNHEFDAGPGPFFDGITHYPRGLGLETDRNVGAQFPYLSANLDFSGNSDFDSVATTEILDVSEFQVLPSAADAVDAKYQDYGQKSVASAATKEVNGETIGIVGLTTPFVESISSPEDVAVLNESEATAGGRGLSAELIDAQMTVLAGQVQPVIDRLVDAGVDKIVLASHLQQIAYEKDLAGKLTDVDIILAGGSDTIQANSGDVLRAEDAAVENYPFETVDANGNPTVIVSTDGTYSYLGRLLVTFDENGLITEVDEASGPVATTDEFTAEVTGTEAPVQGSNAALVETVVEGLESIVSAQDGETFGYSDVYLNGARESVRTEQTNFGVLTAKSMLAASDTEVAIKNGGGIRASIGEIVENADGTYTFESTSANTLSGKEAGEISSLDIDNALRFNNSISTMNVTPSGLKALLEHGVSSVEDGATPGSFPQVAGLAFAYDPELTPGSRIVDLALVDDNGIVTQLLFKDGEQVTGTADQTIALSTLGFLAGGGDGYPFPEYGTNIQDAGIREQQALKDYLAANHATPESAFTVADQTGALDSLIQDLSVRSSTITDVQVNPIRTQFEASIDNGATEILKVSGTTLVTTNSADNTIDVYSVATPAEPTLLTSLDGITGAEITSVDVRGNVVVASFNDDILGQNGQIKVFDITDLSAVTSRVIPVGVHPDSIVMNSSGSLAFTANEGELGYQDGVLVDPRGSISIVDLQSGAVSTIEFDGLTSDQLADVRISPVAVETHGSVTAAAAFDIEPEYVSLSPDESTLFVSLQENNAVAKLDLSTITPGQSYAAADVMQIMSLGTKDHNVAGNGFDASNRDGTIDVDTHFRVEGLYMPDSITTFAVDGNTYFVTANEGDGRGDLNDEGEKGPYGDEVRVKDAELYEGLEAFVDTADSGLGRLKISLVDGDANGDGSIDYLHSFGARSFTIWSDSGEVVFDSGDAFETIIAQTMPHLFNQDDGEFDDRSDDKGPEPEALEVFSMGSETFLAVGLERANVTMLYNVTDPENPVFNGMLDGNASGDLSPEEIEFAVIDDQGYLFTANEVSGTINVTQVGGTQSSGSDLNQLYQTIVGRDIDQQGDYFWSEQIESGQASLTDVAGALLASSEFDELALDGVNEIVDSFYANGLQRDADASGLDYWVGTAEDSSVELVAVSIALSTEAESIWG